MKNLSEESNGAVNRAVMDQLQSVKKVLVHAEVMRNDLHELVGEFSLVEGPRRKLAIYSKAKSIISGFLEQYDNGELANEHKQSDCVGDDCGSSSPYSNELRAQIRLAFEREGSYYLEIMDNVMKQGWLVLKQGKCLSFIVIHKASLIF